jgi:hypothetical protein
MSDPDDPPFKRDEFLDKPGIVGARWWHEGLVHADPMGRRIALQFVLAGAGIATLGLVFSKVSSCASSSDFATIHRKALDAQQEYGWNLGAPGESLTFDGVSTAPYDPAAQSKLPTDLAPAQVALRPYFIPTLLQSPVATPRTALPGDVTYRLDTVVRPIFTPTMDAAYRCGKALASLFDPSIKDVAVVVDLPGPESVAFTAGASSAFDPVFAIDNWPHPRAVVPAHLTLAAAAYYQPLFAKVASTRPVPAPAMFVLDRSRLSPYTDETSQFDNRHVARLPTAAALRSLGIHRLLYVVPLETDVPELDDLNEDFTHDYASGISVKIVGTNAFWPEAPAVDAGANASPGWSIPDMHNSQYYYGGTAATHAAFWVDYPWLSPAAVGSSPPNISPLGRSYVPNRRATQFSAGSSPASSGAASFGTVPIIVSAATGAVLGALLSRSGSWNRSSGGWGG